MKKRLTDFSLKIKTTIQPVFISRKLNEDLKFWEVKPAIVNQQCLVYQFQCNLCDAGYVGYTRGHLTNHEPTNALMDTNRKSSSIFQHYFSEHNSDVPPFLLEQFHELTKGFNKFDCLIKEMLFMRKLKPSLNVQADSISAKVFTWRTCDPLLLCLFVDQIFALFIHFALRMVSWWYRNVGF